MSDAVATYFLSREIEFTGSVAANRAWRIWATLQKQFNAHLMPVEGEKSTNVR